MPHLSSQTAGRLGPSSSFTPSVHTREKKPQTECQISVDNGFTGTEYSLSGMAGRSKPEDLQDCRTSPQVCGFISVHAALYQLGSYVLQMCKEKSCFDFRNLRVGTVLQGGFQMG